MTKAKINDFTENANMNIGTPDNLFISNPEMMKTALKAMYRDHKLKEKNTVADNSSVFRAIPSNVLNDTKTKNVIEVYNGFDI